MDISSSPRFPAESTEAAVARYTATSEGLVAQQLHDHLHGVAARAGAFSAPFGASNLGHLGGLWHDLGKYALDWQRFIRQACGTDAPNAEDAHLAEDHPRRRGRIIPPPALCMLWLCWARSARARADHRRASQRALQRDRPLPPVDEAGSARPPFRCAQWPHR